MSLEKYLYQQNSKPDNVYRNILTVAKEYDVVDFTETEIENLNKIITDISEYYTFVEEHSKNNYPEVLKELFEIIENSNGEYYYCDNFRISNGSKFDELIYTTQINSGCCGILRQHY